MTVNEKILEFALPMAEGLVVADLCIGVGYTCVKLEPAEGQGYLDVRPGSALGRLIGTDAASSASPASAAKAGLAYTFRNDLGSSCGVIGEAGSLIGMPGGQMMKWMLSPNLAQASLGIAAVNAVLNERFSYETNIAAAVEYEPEDVVGMVGYFCPLVTKYSGAKALYIFDRSIQPGTAGNGKVMPEEAKSIFLPKCDIVVLTGTSFINGTADGLLKMCGGAREIIIVGASTPMCPEVLRDYGVTVLAGTRVTEPDQAMRIVAQGGGGMAFSPVSLKLFERLEK